MFFSGLHGLVLLLQFSLIYVLFVFGLVSLNETKFENEFGYTRYHMCLGCVVYCHCNLKLFIGSAGTQSW